MRSRCTGSRYWPWRICIGSPGPKRPGAKGASETARRIPGAPTTPPQLPPPPLPVKVQAGGPVLLRSRLLQQSVHLRVGVLRLVVGTLGVQLDVEEVLRVPVVGHPAQVEHREVAIVQVTQEQAELLLVDLDSDAEVLLPHGDDRFDDGADAGAATGGEEADVSQAAGPTRVLQELLGAVRV